MVWFYGGAFQVGSSAESSYGSRRLMGYDVITVTVNFRTGALGFLSTADDVIPGNQALWDQVLSLRWVQDNIAAFGGDPDSVTIFGQSSGAMSVSSLFLSPQTQGLFHAVITESGSQILPFTYQPNPLPFAKALALHLNCSTSNTSLMLQCLQGVSVDTLYDAQAEFDQGPTASPLYYIPVVDGQVEDGLLPDQPINLIRNEQYNMVPYLSGLTENEGLPFYVGIVLSGVHFDREFINNNLSQLVMNFTYLTGDELTQVTALIYEYYFSDIDLDNETAVGDGVSAVISDMVFNTGHYQMMTLLHKGDGYPAVYSYLFSYHGEYMNFPKSGETSHGDEVLYIFDEGGIILDAQDNVTSERLLTFWTTFAKTGNPNPSSSDVISVTWDAVTSSDSIPYMNLGSELSMEENFRNDRMQFWQDNILPIVFANLPNF
jgi:carboxylesterase type B